MCLPRSIFTNSNKLPVRFVFPHKVRILAALNATDDSVYDLQYTNTAFSTNSADGATFSAAFAELS